MIIESLPCEGFFYYYNFGLGGFTSENFTVYPRFYTIHTFLFGQD